MNEQLDNVTGGINGTEKNLKCQFEKQAGARPFKRSGGDTWFPCKNESIACSYCSCNGLCIFGKAHMYDEATGKIIHFE